MRREILKNHEYFSTFSVVVASSATSLIRLDTIFVNWNKNEDLIIA